MSSLGWLFLCSVFLELEKKFLNAIQGVWELPAVQLHNLSDDPLQQRREDLFILKFEVIHILQLSDDLPRNRNKRPVLRETTDTHIYQAGNVTWGIQTKDHTFTHNSEH